MLITKCDDLLLQSVTASFITKCDNLLLQSATAIFVLHTATSVITKCDKYYKVKQFYYKVRQVLQSGMIITKCDRTGSISEKIISRKIPFEVTILKLWNEAKKERSLRQGRLKGTSAISHMYKFRRLLRILGKRNPA